MADNKYDPKNFKLMEDDANPFIPGSQGAIDLLEKITPADKGQAVPRILIWEIDVTTGKAKHANSDGTPKKPLSFAFTKTPSFGASVDSDFRFRERPPVSLEKIVLKTDNPLGIFCWRNIDIFITVHRPDVVFEEHVKSDGSHVGNEDSWSTLIFPGQTFALEYGWSASTGIDNGIINGDGYSDKKKNILVPGRNQIRFTVHQYEFTIQPNGEIKFVIHAKEAGELQLVNAFLVRDEENEKLMKQAGIIQKNVPVDIYSSDSEALLILLGKLDSLKDHVIKDSVSGTKGIKFGALFDEIFADVIKNAFTVMGYELGGIYVGKFNHLAPKTPKKFGAKELGNTEISEFYLPMDLVQDKFKTLIKNGHGIRLQNFLSAFLDIFMSDSMWDDQEKQQDIQPGSGKLGESGEQGNNKESRRPNIKLRTITSKTSEGKMRVNVFIFDLQRQITKLDSSDRAKLGTLGNTRENVRKIVIDKGVPFVSLVRANSYVKDASFGVIQDELMSSILMQRSLGDYNKTREQITSTPDLATKENKMAHPPNIFSPIIQGELTLLGNFVFDVFSTIWIDFGVTRWDGPFHLFSKEDTITASEFTSKLTVQAAGDDPLGTQGRSR